MTITGCDKLIAKLEKAQESLENARDTGALHDYLVDVWDVGKDVANKCYAEAVTLEGEPANQGKTHVVDPPTAYKNGIDLVATGSDITFLEFGTGLNMTEYNPFANKMGFTPGSWSISHKQFLYPNKIYHFHGSWPHNKQIHWGQNPAKGMYNAYKEMELYIRTTPLRIFR